MSLQFNDTSTYKGLVQVYEDEAGYNRGDVSGNTDLLKDFTTGANLAVDDFLTIAIPASGKWQFDDSNHTDYPTITTNLVSGQRDYTLTTDENGNLALDIFRVMAANSSGLFSELKSVDQQSGSDVNSFFDGQNTGGTPIRYDLTGNGILLDPVPNYNYTNGLKAFINREASYFVYTDTTKKPGVPGIFHKYFALKPALDRARRVSLASYNRLEGEVLKMEAAIKYHFAGRQRGVRRGMRANVESTK